jgi:hypothetical protein
MQEMRLLLCAMELFGCSSTVATTDGGTDQPQETSTLDVTNITDITDVPADRICPPGTCLSPSHPTECRAPGGPLDGCCHCDDNGQCDQLCMCASPDTPIATPQGERPIASLVVGDLVDSIDHGRRVAVPLLRVHRTPVTRHVVMRVALGNGHVLLVSAGHPTADGRTFGALRTGDALGEQQVETVAVVAYPYESTYDILPASDTGTYFASGALVGSTLADGVVHQVVLTNVCGVVNTSLRTQ